MVELYAANQHDPNSTGVLEQTWHSSYRPLSGRVEVINRELSGHGTRTRKTAYGIEDFPD